MKKFFKALTMSQYTLTVREKIGKYFLYLVDVSILCHNGDTIQIEEAKAELCRVTHKSGLYLKIPYNNNDIMLLICDKSMESFNDEEEVIRKNREIADYFWKEEGRDKLSIVFPYTTEYWVNWED